MIKAVDNSTKIINPNYIHNGVCIFCRKNTHETDFSKKPHTITKKLGNNKIGKDICDSCNEFFGNKDKEKYNGLSIEVCVKEVLNLSRIILLRDPKLPYSSEFFRYDFKLHKVSICPKFMNDDIWFDKFTRLFKRGIYEMWLQEYHMYNFNALDSQFDDIRSFARYDIGDIPLYYLVPSGALLTNKTTLKNTSFHINDNSIKDVNKYGFYKLYIAGHVFLLELTPKAIENHELYFDKICSDLCIPGIAFKEIIELKSIKQIDIFLSSLYNSETISDNIKFLKSIL